MDMLYLRNIATFQTLFVAFILHVCIAQGQAKCPVFKVARGTVYKVCVNKPLKISCSLKYCDDQSINIIWTKTDDDMTKWIPVKTTHQISSSQKNLAPHNLTSYLTFTNVSKLHDGLYRCELDLPQMVTVGHHINVSVLEDCTGVDKLCSEIPKVEVIYSVPWWLPYFFICIGVMILLLIVLLIAILCISGFKCFRKREDKEAQYGAQFIFMTAVPDVMKREEFVCVQYSCVQD